GASSGMGASSGERPHHTDVRSDLPSSSRPGGDARKVGTLGTLTPDNPPDRPAAGPRGPGFANLGGTVPPPRDPSAMPTFRTSRGRPLPLGVSATPDGAN